MNFHSCEKRIFKYAACNKIHKDSSSANYNDQAARKANI